MATISLRVRARALTIAAALAFSLVMGATPAGAESPTTPTITTQPDIAVVAEPNAVTSFTAEADGSPTPTIQWQYARDRRGPWTDVPGVHGTYLGVTASEDPSSVFALGNAFRAVFTNDAGVAISRPAKLVWRAQWMRDLGSDIANIPLNQMTIPGTHDMGTYGLGGSSVDSFDGQATLCGAVHTVCERYGRAQAPIKDAEHELNEGIRYFDLRVCGTDLSGGPLVTCHGLTAAPLGEILDQTRAWLDSHPEEVVFLDFNHHYVLDIGQEASEIEAAFALPGGGSMLIPPQYCDDGDVTSGICAGNLTLTGIATQHLGRVIANFVNDGAPGDEHRQPVIGSAFYDHHPLFWGRTSSMPSTFGASPYTDEVLPRVLDSLRHRGSFDPDHFFVQFMQTTPNGSYIAGDLGGSLRLMALDSNPIIGPGIFACDAGDECLAQYRPRDINILAINFYNITDYTVAQFITMRLDQYAECIDHGFGCPVSDDHRDTLVCHVTDSEANCRYDVEVRFDFVEEILRLNAYARTAPVVEVSTATPLPATGWYNGASLGGQGHTLRVDVRASDYRYPTGMTALDCLDNTTFQSLTPGTNAPFVAGHLDLGDGVHVVDCRAEDWVGNRGAGPNSTPAPVIYSIDTVPPSIQCTDAHFLLNQPATLMAGVTDATSGPAAPTVSAAVSTAGVGTFTGTLSASDAAGNTASASCSYTVSYGVQFGYDTTKPQKSGSTVSIGVRLVDYLGVDVSDKATTVVARVVRQSLTGATTVPTSPGASNPGGTFVVAPGGGYRYDLSTRGYAAGSYTLDFAVSGDPIVHAAPFVLR